MVSMDASLIAHLKATDGTDAAVRISGEGKSISVDAVTGNTLARSVRAKPRHNEEGNLKVCVILLARLNRQGTLWRNLRCAEGRPSDVDCVAQNESGDVLKMQVRRADSEESLWREIEQGNTVRDQRSVTDTVQNLRDAIKAKSDKLPLQQKKELLLVLDATETPDHALSQTVELFCARHGAWATGLGFKGIWVVGPTEDFVHRLDE